MGIELRILNWAERIESWLKRAWALADWAALTLSCPGYTYRELLRGRSSSYPVVWGTAQAMREWQESRRLKLEFRTSLLTAWLAAMAALAGLGGWIWPAVPLLPAASLLLRTLGPHRLEAWDGRGDPREAMASAGLVDDLLLCLCDGARRLLGLSACLLFLCFLAEALEGGAL